jgi:hypothetical protein
VLDDRTAFVGDEGHGSVRETIDEVGAKAQYERKDDEDEEVEHRPSHRGLPPRAGTI